MNPLSWWIPTKIILSKLATTMRLRIALSVTLSLLVAEVESASFKTLTMQIKRALKIKRKTRMMMLHSICLSLRISSMLRKRLKLRSSKSKQEYKLDVTEPMSMKLTCKEMSKRRLSLSTIFPMTSRVSEVCFSKFVQTSSNSRSSS